MEIVNASFLALIPVVVGLVHVVRKVGLSTKYAPVVSLAFGVVCAYLVGGSATTVIISGIVVGLSASGLYSGTKTTVE
jgi:hypothetical protein